MIQRIKSFRFKLFLMGWRRQSMRIMDAAGCPMWLIRLRCPVLNGWGNVLSADDTIVGRLNRYLGYERTKL